MADDFGFTDIGAYVPDVSNYQAPEWYNNINWADIAKTYGPTLASGGTALLGGYLNSRAARDVMGQQRDMYNQAAQYNRPASQVNPWATMRNYQDKDGNWHQETTLNEADQKRLDQARAIYADRMEQAGKMHLSSGPIDWNAMGQGAWANAAGAQPGGTTGKRPYADSPYSSVAGEYLNTQYNPYMRYGGVAQKDSGYQPGGVPKPNTFQSYGSSPMDSDMAMSIAMRQYNNLLQSGGVK